MKHYDVTLLIYKACGRRLGLDIEPVSAHISLIFSLNFKLNSKFIDRGELNTHSRLIAQVFSRLINQLVFEIKRAFWLHCK